MLRHERKFWSPLIDGQAARLSMADAHGGEFFMILLVERGARWRQARIEAFEAIEEAIEAGLAPGEVRVG